MAATTWSKTYTDFVTATADKIVRKSFTDNISDSSPVLTLVMSTKGTYESGGTGNEVEEPVLTSLNDTFKWFNGSEEFDTSEQDVGTAAFFQWKQLGGTVMITGEQKRRNQGKEATINLTKARVDQAMLTAKTELAEALWDSGSGTKAIWGIPALCPSDHGVGTAYARVAANTSWWLCQRSRSGETYGNVADFATNFKAYARRLFNDCSFGNMRPDIIAGDQETVEAYDDLLKPMERHTSKKALDLGMGEVLTYQGQPFVWDRFHPDANTSTHRVFMMNSNFIRLRYHPQANFSTSDFKEALNGDYIVAKILWQGSFTTNARRMHGLLTGITGV